MTRQVYQKAEFFESAIDAEARLLDELARAGQPLDEPIQYGDIQRYGGKTKPLWLIVHRLMSGHISATFGDWRQGSYHKFQSWNPDDFTIDVDSINREIEQRQRQAEAKAKRKSSRAAQIAGAIFEHCPTEGESDYLTRKRVQAHGLRFGADEQGKFVAVPMVDLATGVLKSVQRIYEDGAKRFLSGTPLKSNALCHLIGSELVTLDPTAGEVWLAEGYATATVVHEATGRPVLVAFDSGNLECVAKAAVERWPDIQLVIAADNDAWKVGQPVDLDRPNGPKKVNSGLKAAHKAVQECGARVAVPDFVNLLDEDECRAKGEGPTDFNDLMDLASIEVVKRQLKKKISTPNFSKNPSDPFVTPFYPFGNPFGTRSEPFGKDLNPGDLLFVDERGNSRRLIESAAAEKVSNALREQYRWDADVGIWLEWRETHWEPLMTATTADQKIAELIHTGTDPLGYRPQYLNGITEIIKRRGLLPRPPCIDGVIPFSNGLLELDSLKLIPTTPERALDWALPHTYSEADCPNIKVWLLRCVEDDSETVELLRAFWAALLRGIGASLQIFLILIGRGGTGKGTFQRLTMALIGAHNATISTLRDLEENKFETAKLYGKKLCMINEAGKYGGSLNTLLAITGGDSVRLERKHVQQAESFKFHGLVMMASNEDFQSTNLTSGLERRRVTVRFPLSATSEEKTDWEARGGEAAVLHSEIPGLVNWVLSLSETEIYHRFKNLPERVRDANLLGMAAGNSVADWLMENTVPNPDGWAQIGVRREGRDPTTGKTTFDDADEKLYPNYLRWCLEASRRPVSLRKFADTVVDIAETLGHPVSRKRDLATRLHGIKGISIPEQEYMKIVTPDGYERIENRWKPHNERFRTERTDILKNSSEKNKHNFFSEGDSEEFQC